MSKRTFVIATICMLIVFVAGMLAVKHNMANQYMMDAVVDGSNGVYNIDTANGHRYTVVNPDKPIKDYRIIVQMDDNGTPEDATDDIVVDWFSPDH